MTSWRTMKQYGGTKEEVLGPGGYNNMSNKMIHDGWVGPEGSLFFITVDSPLPSAPRNPVAD